MKNEQPTIQGNKLCVSFSTGSVMHIGIRQARDSIKKIETSKRELSESTKARLSTLKAGVDLWESEKVA